MTTRMEIDEQLYNDIFEKKEEHNMFDKIKEFYEDHEYGCQMTAVMVGYIGVCIPLIKWMYKAMAKAITIGINNSKLCS